MSIDLSQFYQVFFEEAGEHLANMESLLLGLDIGDPDAEQLNAIFRAAHSVKGSAGTFGFTDMAEVTHILENLLDRIRKGELALREEMIDAFLEAGDVLKSLLAAHKGGDEADPGLVADTCRHLSSLTGGQAATTPGTEADTAAASAAADAGLLDGCDIHFVLEDPVAPTGEVLDNLVQELAMHGEACVVTVPEDAHEPCSLAFRGKADADTLRGIIGFVARSDSIRIVPWGTAPVGDASDGAYGFFTEEPAALGTTDLGEAYGLFEPTPVGSQEEAYGLFEPVKTGVADEAFGLFEPLANEAVVDPAYGFFDPIPAKDSESGSAAVTVDAAPGPAAVTTEGEGYGLFVETTAAAPAAPAPISAQLPAARETKPAERPAKVPAAKSGGDTTIRVGVEKVDQLINLVGELVITQAMLLQSASDLDPVQFERLHNGLAQLERNSRDLQEAVMSIRMMPISVVFSRFPRVVRELSQKLGKKVELKLVGEGTELDKSLIERITDPLTHLVRNSLDHGVEMPEARAAKGKQPVGTITLRAYHQSGNIVIEVTDDGAGLDRQKILAKAKERGLPVHDQMTDQEVWLLIFEAGFSTADQVTEVSGRGVGMDVVKRNIQAMGGRIEIESMAGIGTRMTVRLPLTLAILDGMSVAVGGETYIVPLGYVVESLQAEPAMVKSISGVRRLLHVRGEYLPVVALHEVFHVPGAVTALERGIMVIIEADGSKVALFLDALVGQQQVVIKSLEANYRKVAGISGATIMGDGHVALILDVAVLAALGRNVMAEAA